MKNSFSFKSAFKSLSPFPPSEELQRILFFLKEDSNTFFIIFFLVHSLMKTKTFIFKKVLESMYGRFSVK